MSEPAGHAPFLYRLARSLFEAPGWREAVALAGEQLHALMPRSSVLIFLLDPERKELRCVHPSEGGALSGRTVRLDLKSDLLVQSFAGEDPRVFEGRRLTPEAIGHLEWQGGEPPGSLTIVPLRHRGRAVGALELAGAAPSPGESASDASLLAEIGSLLGASLGTLRGREGKERGQLEALTRMTQLYDIGRTFNSTLELNELLPLVANRIANIVEVERCHLWLLEGDGSLSCAAAWGPSSEDVLGSVLGPGEGLAGQAAAERKDIVAGDAVAVLLEAKEKPLGVLEVSGHPNLPFLRDLATQAATALHNARLLEAERTVGHLQALLEISREATSTLDLARVLASVVNRGSVLLPYQRAAIGLREGRRIRVAAVSGMLEVDPKSEAVITLGEAVRWAADRDEGVYLSEAEGEIATDLPGAREKFATYFAKTGMRSFVSFPLADEEGQMGVLVLESATPYFLSESQLKVAQILALQATVAIRNARLYQQVPLISIMEPLIRKRNAWLAMSRIKRIAVSGAALLLVGAFVLVPLRLRVGGAAFVSPLRRIAVSAEAPGTVEQVTRREGDRVRAGEVIAVLHDPETQMALARARADLDIARREKSRLEAGLDLARAQMEGTRLSQAEEEVALLEERAQRSRLRAPADGIILTPRIEEKVGSMLRRGEVFCELSDPSSPAVEIQVPEEDLEGIRVGRPVWVKVPAFPSRTFRGKVYQIGARAREDPEGRFFVLRARVEGGPGLRPGMTGRAKVSAGKFSMGYVLLRRPLRWIWGKLWPWLP